MTALENQRAELSPRPAGPPEPPPGYGRNLPAPPSDPSWTAEPEANVILVFASNTEVLNVEDFLEDQELDFELVPVPKEVNPNCGLAISFAARAESGILAALAEAGFRPQASYLRRGDEFSFRERDAGSRS